jgi:hypothetical protein
MRHPRESSKFKVEIWGGGVAGTLHLSAVSGPDCHHLLAYGFAPGISAL